MPVAGFPTELLLVIMIQKLTRFGYRPLVGWGTTTQTKRRTFGMAVSVSWYDSLPLCRCLLYPRSEDGRGETHK